MGSVTDIYIVSLRSQPGLVRLFRKVAPAAQLWTVSRAEYYLRHLQPTSLVVFSDGYVVDPKFYDRGSISGNTLPANIVLDHDHDQLDSAVWEMVSKQPCRVLGFGRGSHFLWSMLGGNIIYQLGGHRFNHDVVDHTTGQVAEVHSSHHQSVVFGTVDKVNVLATDNATTVQGWWNHDQRKAELIYAEKNRPLSSVEAWETLGMMGIQWRPDVSACPVSGLELFYHYYYDVLLED
jgi:hypothetical protein